MSYLGKFRRTVGGRFSPRRKDQSDKSSMMKLSSMPRRKLRIFWFAFKIFFSLALLILLVSHLGSDVVLQIFEKANLGLLFIGVLCLIGQTAISSFKWKLLLRQQGTNVSYLSLLQAYLISNFINLFMPSALGGDAYRAAWLRKYTKGIAAALPSIIVDRVTGIVALAAIASIGLSMMFAPGRTVIILASLAVITVISYVLIAYTLHNAVTKVSPNSFFKLAGILSETLGAIRPSRTFIAVLFLSFVFQFNIILINWIYSNAIGLSVDFLQLLIIVPAVYLMEMIPISINGVGLREGTFTVLFAHMGLPPEEGLALGLTVSVMRYVAGLVGGMLLLINIINQRNVNTADSTASE